MQGITTCERYSRYRGVHRRNLVNASQNEKQYETQINFFSQNEFDDDFMQLHEGGEQEENAFKTLSVRRKKGPVSSY